MQRRSEACQVVSDVVAPDQHQSTFLVMWVVSSPPVTTRHVMSRCPGRVRQCTSRSSLGRAQVGDQKCRKTLHPVDLKPVRPEQHAASR